MINIRTSNGISDKLKYLFNDYSWICAYRQNDIPIDRIKGIQKGYHIVNLQKRYWAADPFLYEEDGDTYLFVEYTDTKKKKSALAVKKILPVEEEKFEIIYEFPYHTSYPCIFVWAGIKYMIPETKSVREIVLLECIKWPYEWKKKSILARNIDAADCTPYIQEGKLFLMIYEENQEISLSTAELNVNTGELYNKKLLKTYKEKIARPGGNIISIDNNIIMVRQPGIKFYGEKIVFIKCEIAKDSFSEEILNEILPEQIDIEVDGKIIGIHTYNRINNMEVIDIFVKKINIIKPLLYFFHRLRILGFGEYEKDQKILWKRCL